MRDIPQKGIESSKSLVFFLYILRSEKTGRYYIGQTHDLEHRLSLHNQGRVRSTKAFLPWQLVHQESYETRLDSMRRESEIKGYKGGFLFKKLLGLLDQ